MGKEKTDLRLLTSRWNRIVSLLSAANDTWVRVQEQVQEDPIGVSSAPPVVQNMLAVYGRMTFLKMLPLLAQYVDTNGAEFRSLKVEKPVKEE